MTECKTQILHAKIDWKIEMEQSPLKVCFIKVNDLNANEFCRIITKLN
jgi:hypothetical protein